MKIFLGSDHGGVQLKKELFQYLEENFSEFELCDFNNASESAIDYPIVAMQMCDMIIGEDIGVLICGSGIGISMAANKVKGIRCALIHDAYSAKMAKRHNNANVLAFGQRAIGSEVAKDALGCFLKERFESGRHCRRVDLLSDMDYRE